MLGRVGEVEGHVEPQGAVDRIDGRHDRVLAAREGEVTGERLAIKRHAVDDQRHAVDLQAPPAGVQRHLFGAGHDVEPQVELVASHAHAGRRHHGHRPARLDGPVDLAEPDRSGIQGARRVDPSADHELDPLPRERLDLDRRGRVAGPRERRSTRR